MKPFTITSFPARESWPFGPPNPPRPRAIFLSLTPPGVAEPCRAIARNPEDAFRYTNRGNLVAVVSNGTAVLGLGNIGALAGKPVMEGKAVLFKRFADIDVFDLEIDAPDPDDVIRFCELLEPTVGGINLEDIRAPDCFYIESELRKRLNIPVFHDDQHGTAIIAGAAFLNACELVGKPLEEMRVVFSGAGAAGIATARFFHSLGVNPENTLMVDSRGVVHTDRDDLTPIKSEFARTTTARTLAEALRDADAFVGVSVAGAVKEEMIEAMAPDPLIFALANPDPEITYDAARATRPDAVVATGRSDYPNQVNNVLGFPFIFRGSLDVRAQGVSEGMKVAAARALADLARQPVPESVLKAYQMVKLGFGRDYLIPKPFDPRVLWTVAPAVAEAATREGIAGLPLADVEAYADELRARFQSSHGLLNTVTAAARTRPMRVVYPHGDDVRIMRAARRVLDEGIGSPVLLGAEERINELADELGIDLGGIDLVDPSKEVETLSRYADTLTELRQHRGMTRDAAATAVADHNMYASLMLREDRADAVFGGLNTFYPDTIRPALQVLSLEPNRTIVSSVYVVVVKGSPYFFTDCAVNIEPNAEELVEIANAAVVTAREHFNREARVGFLSYSDFGSAAGAEPDRVRRAVELFRKPLSGRARRRRDAGRYRCGLRSDPSPPARGITRSQRQRLGLPQSHRRQCLLQAAQPAGRR